MSYRFFYRVDANFVDDMMVEAMQSGFIFSRHDMVSSIASSLLCCAGCAANKTSSYLHIPALETKLKERRPHIISSGRFRQQL